MLRRTWGEKALIVVAMVVFLALLEGLVGEGKTFVVNTVDDEENAQPDATECRTTFSTSSQPRCTLRAAIQAANASPGPDVIEFDIPPEECQFEPVCIIQLMEPLPPIRPRFDLHPKDIASLTIDASRDACTPVTPCIVIDGGLLPASPLPLSELDALLGESLRLRDALVRSLRDPGRFPYAFDSNGDGVVNDQDEYIGQLNRIRDAFPDPSPLRARAQLLHDAGVAAAQGNHLSEALRTLQQLLEMLPLASGHCLYIDSNDNTIQGLILSRCPGNGVEVHGSNNLLQGIKSGTDAFGLEPEGNRLSGVRINGLADSFDPAPCPFQNDACRGNPSVAVAAARNWIHQSVISGNFGYGIEILGPRATLNRVEGTRVGVNILGNKPLGNQRFGIFIGGGSTKNFIGGGADTSGNWIGGNNEGGIHITGLGTDEHEIRKNFIGTDALGEVRLGNSGPGILISCGPKRIRIGTPGAPLVTTSNVIAFNTEHGVVLRQPVSEDPNDPANQGCVPPEQVTISGNSIYLNGNGTHKAIALLDGSNREISAPFALSEVVINSISGNRRSLQGKTQPACPNCVVEIYSDAGEFAQRTSDGSFIGVQGRFYEGFTLTDPNGEFRFDEETVGIFVTATVTDHQGNTSELSNAIAMEPVSVTSAPVPVILSITPNRGEPGQTLEVILTGANFTGATAVSFGEGILVTSFSVQSDTRITANITISATAPSGLRDVRVTGPGGTGTRTGGFRVVGPPPSDVQVQPLLSRCLTTGAGGRAVKVLRLTNQSGGPTGDVTIVQIQAAAGSDWTGITAVMGKGRSLPDGRSTMVVVRGTCSGSNLEVEITLSNDSVLTASTPSDPHPRRFPAVPQRLWMSVRAGLLSLLVQGNGAEEVRLLTLRLFGMDGRLALTAKLSGNRWVALALLQDHQGNPLANGIYLAVVELRRPDGSLVRVIQKITVVR